MNAAMSVIEAILYGLGVFIIIGWTILGAVISIQWFIQEIRKP
jgi:hypothetical protein